jgi:hypothetical protein
LPREHEREDRKLKSSNSKVYQITGVLASG